MLARSPPGDTPVYHGHHLFAVPPTTAANRLQDDPAEGCQAIYVGFPGCTVQRLEFACQLGEEGVLASEGDHPQDRHGLGNQLPPEVIRHRVISQAWAGWGWGLVTTPGSAGALPALLALAGPRHQEATVLTDRAFDGVKPDGNYRGVGTLLQMEPLHVGGTAQLSGPLGTRAAKGATPGCWAQGRPSDGPGQR